MNYDNECYIVYDKYGGVTHSFTNPLTKDITIKELFENRMDDGKTEYLTGHQAIKKFNQKFGSAANFKLPDDIDEELITVHMFCFKNDVNCEILITILGV